jgi:MoaA/NifB/PqqE/SkfB family radical SAM enzyme
VNIVEPRITKRAFIDVGRLCQVHCIFCYHRFVPLVGFKSYSDLRVEIDRARNRGNSYLDFTGGEPSLVPHLPDIIEYANYLNIKSCVITNGVINPKRLDRFIGSGVDDWLLSVHGGEASTHDRLVDFKGARTIQQRTVNKINRSKATLRFNVVMNKFNYKELIDIAELAIRWRAVIVNFINFNPHHAWKQHFEEAREVIADLRDLQPYLTEAISILEEYDIGVNVRYYPMCRISEQLRRTVCNDLHVMFDPYEWCYYTTPRTFDSFRAKTIEMSNETEEKNSKCAKCDLLDVCGGINKHFNKFTNESMIDNIKDFKGDKKDFYYYRKHNYKTLQERV